MAEINSFPIQVRKTSEFDVATALPSAANLVFWSGVGGQNLKRIGLVNLINELAKFFTAAIETLSADRNITSADSFVQLYDAGGSDRAVTVDDGISCFVHCHPDSTNKLTVEGTDLEPGESAFVFWDGTSSHTAIKLAASSGEPQGTAFLDITETDSDDDYYYYGGVDSDLNWKINRFDKLDLDDKFSATQINNSGYATLSGAWVDRASLIYG